MEQEHQGTDFEEVAGPRETHQQDCSHVVNKHDPKVFSADIDELGKEETPVERKLSDVVPPHIVVHGVMWIVGPTVRDIPKPALAPQADLKFHLVS
jgi:hypothetical protein